MTTVEMPEERVVQVSAIKPYWRNPRAIPESAVDAVADSIVRYGYQQPIVTDSDLVVIVGHTRLRALQKLGIDTVPVYVSQMSEEKAKEYRLIDNRTSEMSTWDHDQLVAELREWEQGLIDRYFPDVDLELATLSDATGRTTADEIEQAEEAIKDVNRHDPILTVEVECPSCFHVFKVRTDTLPVSDADLATVRSRAG